MNYKTRQLAVEDFYRLECDRLTVELGVERRQHRTTSKYLRAYRWISCTGWAIAVMSLLGWLPC